jgi:alkylhydroperoxidase family enzyme
MVGLSSDQIRDSRLAVAVDGKNSALLQFVRKVVDERGHVSDEDLDGLRQHGFTDGQIAEVVANVALNLFTNYFNHIAETDIDFPKAPTLNAESASTN